MTRRRALLAGTAGAIAAATTAGPRAARAQASPGRPVRIGVMNDMSGVYADYQGRGSVVAA